MPTYVACPARHFSTAAMHKKQIDTNEGQHEPLLSVAPRIAKIPSTPPERSGRSLEPCSRIGPDQRPCRVLVCPAWLNADTHRICRAPIAQRSALRAIAFPLRVAGPTKLGRTAPSPATSPALLAAHACVAEAHSRRTPVTGITGRLDGDDQHAAAFLRADGICRRKCQAGNGRPREQEDARRHKKRRCAQSEKPTNHSWTLLLSHAV